LNIIIKKLEKIMVKNMTYENIQVEKQQLVKDFLNLVKEKLPGWLKEEKKEVEILEELEQHVWDKATELANGNEPNASDVRQAIASMGSPTSIAREFKKRGTPKVFISEELWPWYIKILSIFLIIIVGANGIGFIVGLFSNPLKAVTDLFSGIWSGAITITLIISAVFMYLSTEGFLPEDFKEIAEIEESKKTDSNQTHIKIVVETKKKPAKVKAPVNMQETLFSGIWGLVWGFLLISMPIQFFRDYLGPDFVTWLAFAGVFSVFSGIVHLIQALLGSKQIVGQQICIIVAALFDVAFLPYALQIPNLILGIPAVAALEVGVLSIVTSVMAWLPLLIILGTIVGFIEEIVKAAMYRGKYEKYLAAKKTEI
jgi:hypothetical protein